MLAIGIGCLVASIALLGFGVGASFTLTLVWLLLLSGVIFLVSFGACLAGVASQMEATLREERERRTLLAWFIDAVIIILEEAASSLTTLTAEAAPARTGFRRAYIIPVANVRETRESKHCRVAVGSRLFDFEMTRCGGVIRNYILTQVDYGGLPTDGHSTHRYHEGKRYFVCTQTPIPDFETAREWAAVWAQYTEHYLRTGRPVPAIE